MSTSAEKPCGKLYLVSAGIGDAENMTIKALKIIQKADLLLAMPFVHQQLSELLPKGVPLLDPGHGLFTPHVPSFGDPKAIARQEEEIRTQIRHYVDSGQSVVLIEFGDPLLLGPQIGYLEEFRDLKPEILPGISCFNAANAQLCQPVLGGKNRQLMMSTLEGLNNWQGTLPDMLVLFTMQLELPQLSHRLRALYPGDTMLALVCHAGFSQHQQVHYLCLEQLEAVASGLNIPWECLIYVGNIDAI